MAASEFRRWTPFTRKCRSPSEEPQCFGAVADEQILGLLIVVEHHLVVLAPDTRLLVAAERRMRRVEMIAIGPDPTGLDRAAEAIGAAPVAGPDAGAKAVKRVVSDRQRLVVILERASPTGRGRRSPPGRCASCCAPRARSGLHNSHRSDSPPKLDARVPPVNTLAPSALPISI